MSNQSPLMTISIAKRRGKKQSDSSIQVEVDEALIFRARAA
jgi:hypothetical protein